MTLTRTPRRAFTSITVASRRRSSSPSSSASPDLLHLSELSTDAVDDAAEQLPPTTEEHRNTEPTAAFEPGSLLSQGTQSQTSQLQPGTQTRQVAIGGHLEEADVPTEASSRGADTDTQSVGHGEESSVPYGCVSVCGAEEEAAPSPPESPAPSGHVSHAHLTLSPRTSSHSLIPLMPSLHPAMWPEELLSDRRRSSPSSPDEGVGLSSPAEGCRSTQLMRQQGPCTLYRTGQRLPSPLRRGVVSPQTTEAAGRLSPENKGLSPISWGGGCCGNSVPHCLLVFIFPLKRCRFCCLINRAAVRSCFTSLSLKLPSLLTPPWRAPTQVRSILEGSVLGIYLCCLWQNLFG